MRSDRACRAPSMRGCKKRWQSSRTIAFRACARSGRRSRAYWPSAAARFDSQRAQLAARDQCRIADPEAQQIVHAAHALSQSRAGEAGEIAFGLAQQPNAAGQIITEDQRGALGAEPRAEVPLGWLQAGSRDVCARGVDHRTTA